MSEQPSGQGWLGDFGREQYQPPDQPGWAASQQARSQPPWEHDPSGAPSWDAGPGAPGGGPPAPGPGQPAAGAGRAAEQPGPGQPAPGAGQSAEPAAGAPGGPPGTASWTFPGRGARAGQGRGAGPHRGGGHSPLPIGEGRDFLNALADLRFTSFVTPKIIKALYLLVMVAAGLGALALAVSVLAVSLIWGLVVLIIVVPLGFLVVTGLCRVALEFFMIVLRMAEDIRTMRERGGDLP